MPDSGWVDDTIEIHERECPACKGLKYRHLSYDENVEFHEFKALEKQYKKLARKYKGIYNGM